MTLSTIPLLLQDAAASGSGLEAVKTPPLPTMGSGLVKTPPSGSTALGSTSSSSPFAKEGEVIIASLGPGPP